MAHDNAIRGNVFLHDGDMRLTFNRSQDFTFEGNVLSAGGRIVIPQADVITRSSRNIFHSRARAVEGAPEGTLLADPRLENIRPGQYAFAAGSPAGDWELPPIDVSGAGPRA
jgi:hypothetical protein